MERKDSAIELFQKGLTLHEVAEKTGLSEFTIRKYRAIALRDRKGVKKSPIQSEWSAWFSEEWIRTVNRIRKYMGKDAMKESERIREDSGRDRC